MPGSLTPAAVEAMFVSTAHTEKDLARTLAAQREALKEAFGAGRPGGRGQPEERSRGAFPDS
jgi:hypothetical protein